MKLIAFGLLLLALAVTTQFVPGPAAQADTANVAVSDSLAFIDGTSSTSTTTITAGDTVIWTWGGANFHSVTSDTGSFLDSGTMETGTYSKQFATPGTFTYHCVVHPLQMTGTVVVQAAANTPTSTATAVAQATNTATATATGLATGTSTASATAQATPATSATAGSSTSTPAPASTSAPAVPTSAAGAAAAGASLPATGDGAASGGAGGWLGAVMGLCGAIVVGAGIVVRRRRT